MHFCDFIIDKYIPKGVLSLDWTSVVAISMGVSVSMAVVGSLLVVVSHSVVVVVVGTSFVADVLVVTVLYCSVEIEGPLVDVCSNVVECSAIGSFKVLIVRGSDGMETVGDSLVVKVVIAAGIAVVKEEALV